MNNRIAIIEDRLTRAFSPSKIQIIDDSEKHIGHAGSRDGAGHFTVIINADCFKEISRVAAHRLIYNELDDLIPKEIHALKIIINPK